MKRLISMLLVVTSLVMLATGCGTKNDGNADSSNTAAVSTQVSSATASADTNTGKPTEFKKIIMLSLGDESNRMKEYASNEMKEKLLNELNTELEIQYLPWAAYGKGQKIDMMIASGQEFDFTFTDIGWLSSLVQKQGVSDLTEAVDKFAPDLKKNLTPEHLQEFTIDGKLYAIPLGYAPMASNNYSIAVRQDLLEEVGMSEIKTIDDLYNFASLTKVKHPDMYATPGGSSSTMYPYIRGLSDKNYTLRDGYLMVDEDASEGKLVSLFDSPEFKAKCEFFNKMYTNNLLPRDILTNKTGDGALFESGKYMWMVGRSGSNTLVENLPNLQKNVPTAKIKEYMFASEKPKIKTSYSSTCVMVPSYSKNADRVAMVMNLMQKDVENFDFFVYGVQDKDYKLVNDKIERINKDEFFFQWALFNVNFPRYESTFSDEYIAVNKTWDNGAVASKIFGFVPNYESVKVEKAKVDGIIEERAKALWTGVISYEKGYDVLKKELTEAGLDKVLDEIQKQFTSYRATKK